MYNSFMGEWTVQISEKQLECKVRFRNIYPDIAGVRWSAALFLADSLQGFNENNHASPCLFGSKGSLSIYCSWNLWFRGVLPFCLLGFVAGISVLILTQTCFTIWWPYTQHFNKNNPLPQHCTTENISVLKSLNSVVFISVFSIHYIKLGPWKSSLSTAPFFSIQIPPPP